MVPAAAIASSSTTAAIARDRVHRYRQILRAIDIAETHGVLLSQEQAAAIIDALSALPAVPAVQ